MSRIRDNWYRLVTAVLKREKLRRLAYCRSIRTEDDPPEDDPAQELELEEAEDKKKWYLPGCIVVCRMAVRPTVAAKVVNPTRPKKELQRLVQVVRIQRKKKILKQRLKVPPPIHEFSQTLDKNLATTLFKMLLKYRPENRGQKKERLLKRAQGEEAQVKSTKPIVVKYGLNHVTSLIEQKKAKLVVIAHDVDPLELVVWVPALCRKMQIPYCIVKGKARLGTIVHKKTASVLCLTSVRNHDRMELTKIIEAISK